MESVNNKNGLYIKKLFEERLLYFGRTSLFVHRHTVLFLEH